MLPTSAGVEPATSWSPVGRRIQLSHRGRQEGREWNISRSISMKCCRTRWGTHPRPPDLRLTSSRTRIRLSTRPACFALTLAVGYEETSAKEQDMWPCNRAGHAHWKIESMESTKSVFSRDTVYFMIKLKVKYRLHLTLIIPSNLDDKKKSYNYWKIKSNYKQLLHTLF